MKSCKLGSTPFQNDTGMSLLMSGIVSLVILVATGMPAYAQQLLYAPVSGSISSNFGWRNDPIVGGSRFHAGVDIAASEGIPVYAPQNAYVAYSGSYKGYGNVVVLDHGYGLYTLYGHASTLYVRAGQPVFRGQPIAAVGSTGRSTGPHLHFEVHQNGQYVDPLVYLAYLSQTGQQITSTSQALRIPTQPIQVTLSQGQQQVQPPMVGQNQQAVVDGIPAQVLVAQSHFQTVSTTSQGVSIPVQKSVRQAPKSHQKSLASKASRRLGRYLVSSAIQVVSGGRVNWVRF